MQKTLIFQWFSAAPGAPHNPEVGEIALPAEVPAELAGKLPHLLTPGAAEALAVKLFRHIATAEVPNPEPAVILAEILSDYQPPVAPEIMQFQIGLAVREASDLDFVPVQFRLQPACP